MAREDISLDFRPNNLIGREEGKEREMGEKKKVEREALPSLEIFRRSDRRFPAKQDGKSFLATIAASRDRKLGVSTNFER